MKPIITQAAALKALQKRQKSKAAQPAMPMQLDASFPQQNTFILDPARFLAVQCSRRAGKTNALAIRFMKTLEKHPGSQCLYLSLTFDSARDIMWPVLREIDKKYKIGCSFIDSRLVMTHPNGAKLRLLGADMKNFVKRLKGVKSPGIAIDEAQDFGTHLQSLVDDVLTPTMTDYTDSWLALTGTPGPVPQGYFFDITQQKKYGYSFHAWTLVDNPYLPDPKTFLADLKAKREWADNNPTLLREWLNNWVLDVKSLWIQYVQDKDHYDVLPAGNMEYILGVDIGYNDADAIAVLGWTQDSKDAYLVEEIITPKQGLTELVEQLQATIQKYRPTKIIIDEGGLGKKMAEEIRRRHGIALRPADKARKQENVTILNDALRLGRCRIKASSRFAQDSYLVQIDWDKSTPDRIVVKKKPHSDIIDAVLYAFKETPAYTYVQPTRRPAYGSKEWAAAQPQDMWEAAVDHFTREGTTDDDR